MGLLRSALQRSPSGRALIGAAALVLLGFACSGGDDGTATTSGGEPGGASALGNGTGGVAGATGGHAGVAGHGGAPVGGGGASGGGAGGGTAGGSVAGAGTSVGGKGGASAGAGGGVAGSSGSPAGSGGSTAGASAAGTGGSTAGASGATSMPTVPGGREHFVVAAASLTATSVTNWVRLGTYEFDGAKGTVANANHTWSQSAPVQRVASGITPAGGCSGTASTVHSCDILIPDGYAQAPNEVRSGSFALGSDAKGPFVKIHWNAVPHYDETWSIVDAADHKAVSLVLRDGGGVVSDGWGGGSHRLLTERRAMSSVQASTISHYDFVGWAHGAVSTATNKPWTMPFYGVCGATSWVMTGYQPSSATSCQAGCVAPYDKDTSIEYYISRIGTADRRDTLWHWCSCLAKGQTCYGGNSHVKPMLQILDDDGSFRGWVGVEASFQSGTPNTNGDMLSVWRVYNP